MSNLICLGAGIENAPVLSRARELGHTVIAVDGNPDAPGFTHAAVRVVASCYHTEQVLPALGYALNTAGLTPDGVLCAGVDAPHVAAAVASAYPQGARSRGLPGLTPEAARLSQDKLAQKTALHAAGLPVPRFQDVRDGIPYRRYPLVIKPMDSRGARGVVRLERETYLWDKQYTQAKAASPTGRVMVEEYLPGPQLSTESIVVDGRVLFTAVALRNYARLAEFAPHIIEDGFDMPYGDTALVAEVDSVIESGCAALGWKTLTVKADLIIHDGRVVILELAARLSGGFLSTHGTALAYHYPLVDVAIHLALNEWPKFVVGAPQRLDGATLKPIPDFVCQRYVFPEPGDIGRRVVNVPRIIFEYPPDGACLLQQISDKPPMTFAKDLIGIRHATYAVRPGDVLRPVTDHGARLGQAIATGSTPEQARERAEQAVKAMRAAIILE